MLGPEWPYCVVLDRDNWPEIQDWCVANIGEFDQDWYKLGVDPMAAMIGNRQTTWFFRHEQHAVFFKLKWV